MCSAPSQNRRNRLRSCLLGCSSGNPGSFLHFGAVLLLAAILSAPWHGIGTPAVLWGLPGLSGILYEIVLDRLMRVQTAYQPELENWLFHVLLPFAAYATLAGSVYLADSNVGRALFGVGTAALLLLFIGIHNAWDGVTYHVFCQTGGTGNWGRH